MNLSQQTKSFRTVPKRNAFKAQNNISGYLIIWVDVARVRENFNYSIFRPILFFKRYSRIDSAETPLSLAIFSNRSKVSFSNALFIYFETLSSGSLVNKRSIERSCGTRTCNFTDLLFFIPVGILRHPIKYFIKLTKNNFNRNLTCSPPLFYSVVHLIATVKCIITIAQRVRTSMSYLTQPLNEVMIMANRYDTAHLCARQSKLYKFYDLSTAQVVQSIAPTERQARKNLGKQSLIFIARIPLYPIIASKSQSHLWGHSYE